MGTANMDFPTVSGYKFFYLDGALVSCTTGPKPVCVALLDEDGGILLNCYVVPNGAVTCWNTQSTNLKSFNDLLECNPVHLEQVTEYLHHFICPESILIGHGIGAVVEACGLQRGEDYGCIIDTSDWFAVQLSPTLCQPFSLAHIVKLLLGDDVPDHDSSKRDPLLDAQYARMLYSSYRDVPYDHPIMCQARETLYMALPKEKRLVDPALTVILSCIPEGMSAKELKKMVIPRQVTHVVDKLSEIEWAEEKGGRVGKTVVVFKNTHDVAQMILRLHSNPDDWDWCVKKEGQTYINKHNGIKVEEADDVALKVYVHSIPDDWSEVDVKKRVVPAVLAPHVKEVKPTQFRKTKAGSRLLGRTHIMFYSDWCVLEMMRLMQVMPHDWGWTTQSDGSLLFSRKKDHILVEPALPLSFEELMSTCDPMEQPAAPGDWMELRAAPADMDWGPAAERPEAAVGGAAGPEAADDDDSDDDDDDDDDDDEEAEEEDHDPSGDSMDAEGVELEVVEVVEVVEVGPAAPRSPHQRVDRCSGQRWADFDPDEEVEGFDHDDLGPRAMVF